MLPRFWVRLPGNDTKDISKIRYNHNDNTDVTHTYHVDEFSLPLISGWNATNMNGTPENQMAKWFVAAGLYGGTAYSFVQIAAGECL